MNAESANKIIAEYMGGPYEGDSMYCSFDGEAIIPDIEDQIKEHYLSLDALVPVWEKLNKTKKSGYLEITQSTISGWQVAFRGTYIASLGDSLPEAAAIATAKMIKELKQ